jgi:signal transduction histidine kinase
MSSKPGGPSVVTGPSRGATAAIAAAALVAAAGGALLDGTSDHLEHHMVKTVFGPLVGLSFVGTGLYAWRRRPESRFGVLMVLLGFTWFLSALSAAEAPLLFTLGIPLGSIWPAVFIHILLSDFPTGRLGSRHTRRLAVAGYVLFVPGLVPALLTGAPDVVSPCVGPCPENVLQVVDNDTLARGLLAVESLLIAGLCAAVLVELVRRWRRAGPALRRALGPVYVAGAVVLASAAALMATRWEGLLWVALAAFAAFPLAFLSGLLRVRLARAAVGDLMVALRDHPDPTALHRALADALGDPSLRLAYWLPELGAYADVDGVLVDVADGPGRAATSIEHDGQPVAVLLHDAALLDTPELLEAVSAAASIAIQQARLEVELHQRLHELEDSRARIVEATQDERRRLERNLHDGAQQRLVSMSMELTLMERRLSDDPTLAHQVERLRLDVAACMEELRDLARGLHPAIVTAHGLTVAMESLAMRSPVRVVCDADGLPRLPEPLEVAVYFFVAECLTNVAKYAQASEARVTVRLMERRVVAEVSDNGVGGADPRAGSGLLGLVDRIEALGGRLEVASSPGGGTHVRAELPHLAAEPVPASEAALS